MRDAFSLYSWINCSFAPKRSASERSLFCSMRFKSMDRSGKTKKFGFSVLPLMNSNPFSVISTWLFFSSIVNKRGATASGIIFWLSAKKILSVSFINCFIPFSERNLINGFDLGKPLNARYKANPPSFLSPAAINFFASTKKF